MKIGIIGNGFVGKASRVLENSLVDVIVYDIDPKLCVPGGITLGDMIECDLIFISVPTPMNFDGSVHSDIVGSVIRDIKKCAGDRNSFEIVVRSTVAPGTCASYDVYFMPEFLTEKNYLDDFINNKLWIFGLRGDVDSDLKFKKKIELLVNSAYYEGKIKYNDIEWMTNTEAEMVKYYRNTFLAVKVSYANELHEFCVKKNLDYEKIRKIAAVDDRIGLSHTQVPGADGSYGYGGSCLPKDVRGLLSEMEKAGMRSYVLSAVVGRNQNVDRVKKDWVKDK
ncbi:MAG: hypothetical protein Hyperionvirus21_23 [Hyperionvirus sp.]|uniref:UDP-glucose 6-dehydrogenase n=1 Tax=Hyperionvirus sp. TaxID=2487770 RepID=A0A3G5AFX8_9VIRU|nr:MAG: hypothetical protein Hyperionvirus21_23 [Hyperionvirus sp.]